MSSHPVVLRNAWKTTSSSGFDGDACTGPSIREDNLAHGQQSDEEVGIALESGEALTLHRLFVPTHCAGSFSRTVSTAGDFALQKVDQPADIKGTKRTPMHATEIRQLVCVGSPTLLSKLD